MDPQAADQSTASPSSSPRRGLSSAFRASLHRARQILAWCTGLEVLLAAVAGGLAATVVAVIALGVVPFSSVVRFSGLGGIVVGVVLGAAHVLVHKALPLRDDLVVAGLLEIALRRLGVPVTDTIRAAVELLDVDADARLGRSRALCDAHIDQARVLLSPPPPLPSPMASLPAVVLERAVATLLGSAAVFALVLLGLFFAGDTVSGRLAMLFSGDAAATALAERAAQAPPLVTDITLTLHYPAYMARADDVIPGTTGDVNAPKGTEVIVEGRVDTQALGAPMDGGSSSAALLVTGGPQELALAAEVKDGKVVVGRFVVAAPGAWRFKLTGKNGRERIDPVARKILVRADAAPTVRLDEPDADRVVQLDEEVPVVFFAEDDVGITKVRVTVKRQGSAREAWSLDLADGGGQRQLGGGGRFVVQDTGARPGEKLAVTVEALDNDVESGPNVGRSTTRILTVFSAAVHHREVIDLLQALMMEMVEVLGDELESPVDVDVGAGATATAPAPLAETQKRILVAHRQLAPRANAMMKRFDETLAAVADDEMLGQGAEGEGAEGVRRALANMRLELGRAVDNKVAAVERTPMPEGASARTLPLGLWRRVVDGQRRLVDRLESDILYLEDLLQRERVQEAEQLVTDMKRAQEDIKALLQQYKENGDPDAREKLLDEIRRMQSQLADLAKRLGELRREVPDEYLNEEAFKADEMFENASSLDEMIEEGRLEDAAKALEEMLESTSKMLEELNETKEELGGDEAKALREKMERFGQELTALEEAQKEELQQTERLMDAARKRLEEQNKKALEKAIKEARAQVKKAQEQLKGVNHNLLSGYEEEDAAEAQARTDDTAKALESGDLEDALRAVEEAERAARSAQGTIAERSRFREPFSSSAYKDNGKRLDEASHALKKAQEILQEAMPDPSQALTPQEKDRLQKSAERQQQLAEQAQKLAQQMGEIGKEAPIFGPEHEKKLAEAQGSMQQAGESLKEQASGKGSPHRRGRRRSMSEQGLRGARSSQSQALQRLSSLREDLEQMGKGGGGGGGGIPMPLPNGGAPGAERGEREGQRGKSREDVKIPDGSDFKVKDAFRKDILDAMREGAPEDWKGEVKRYYEELIK